MIVPLVVESAWLFAGMLVAGVGLLVVIGRALAGGDDWSTGRRGGSGGDDVVCPRCHHRTPPDATRCPECGKSL
jgi:hypothetical protein